MKFTYASGSRPLSGYTIKRGIGIGGFGEVYFAFSDAGKEVALKKIQRNLDVELRGVKQCLNIRHANLISLFDIRTCERDESWVVMEFVPGRSLRDIIGEFPNGLPESQIKRWFTSIVSGVAHLHQRGIVHRDLKPGNVFHDDDIHAVKIGDYGLAKFISAGDSGHTDAVGTVHYMAPEIGNGVYGREIDIYALGILLYELLTGDVPFDGESAQEILLKHLTAAPDMSQIPVQYRPAIEGALVKDPHSRFSSVSELVATLPWPSVAAKADRIATLHIVEEYATPIVLPPRENIGATSITPLIPGGAYVRPILVTEVDNGPDMRLSASTEPAAGIFNKVDRSTTPPHEKSRAPSESGADQPSTATPGKLPRRTTVRIAKQDMPSANLGPQSDSPTNDLAELKPTEKIINAVRELRRRVNRFQYATFVKIGLLSLVAGILFTDSLWGPLVFLALALVPLMLGVWRRERETALAVGEDDSAVAVRDREDNALTMVRAALICGLVAASIASLTFIVPHANTAKPLARWAATMWSVTTAISIGWTGLLLTRYMNRKATITETSKTHRRIATWTAGIVAGGLAVALDIYLHEPKPLSETFRSVLLTGTDHFFLPGSVAMFLIFTIWFSTCNWSWLTDRHRESTVSLTLTLLFLASATFAACVAGFSLTVIGIVTLGVLVGIQLATPSHGDVDHSVRSAVGSDE